MDRRTLLATLGSASVAAMAGCLDRGQDSLTVEPGVQRRVTLDGQETVPDRHRLRITAEVTEPLVTDAHTARIRTAVTNEGRERALTVGPCALLNRETAASDPQGLWLESESDAREQEGNAWIAELPESGGFGGYGCSRRPLGSGEAVEDRYTLWDDGRVDGYLVPGTYRWGTRVAIWPDAETGEPSAEFEWGFSLTVERE